MKTSKTGKYQIALLLLPGILIFGLFTVYPIVKLFVMSFFKWDFESISGQIFIGLENYREVLSDEYFRTSFANTLIYTLVTVPGQMIIGFLAGRIEICGMCVMGCRYNLKRRSFERLYWTIHWV